MKKIQFICLYYDDNEFIESKIPLLTPFRFKSVRSQHKRFGTHFKNSNLYSTNTIFPKKNCNFSTFFSIYENTLLIARILRTPYILCFFMFQYH